MARKVKEAPKLVVPEGFKEEVAIEGYDLSAKHAVWNPLDKIAIKGLLLGIVQLPSVQAEQEHWTCYLVELTGSTIVRDAATGVPRQADKGERVVLTATSSLRRLEDAAKDPRHVFPIFLKYGGKEETKAGFRVNVFDHMIVGRPQARTANYVLPSSNLTPRLGMGLANGAGSSDDLPFDEQGA